MGTVLLITIMIIFDLTFLLQLVTVQSQNLSLIIVLEAHLDKNDSIEALPVIRLQRLTTRNSSNHIEGLSVT